MGSYKSAWTIGFGLFFVSIGSLILLDNLDILYFKTVWSFVWPLLLIIFGFILVFRKKNPPENINIEDTKPDENVSSDTYAEVNEPEMQNETSDMNSGERSNETARTTIVNDNQQSHYFGNINYSSTDKAFEGLNISNIFGDIYIDISQIDFEPGEKIVNISGIFGSIRVKLPENIPAKFIGSTIAGSVKFMDKDKDGLLASLNSQMTNFDSAEKKILIRTSIIFGDIVAK